MSVFATLIDVTVRGLLGRRRLLLMLLLAAIPVVLGVLVSLRGGRADVDRVLGVLVVQTVMPLIALILGTAALGSEIEDGTIVYLLIKPIQRWIDRLLEDPRRGRRDRHAHHPGDPRDRAPDRRLGPGSVKTTLAFAIACAAGGAAYAAVFVALSSLTAGP